MRVEQVNLLRDLQHQLRLTRPSQHHDQSTIFHQYVCVLCQLQPQKKERVRPETLDHIRTLAEQLHEGASLEISAQTFDQCTPRVELGRLAEALSELLQAHDETERREQRERMSDRNTGKGRRRMSTGSESGDETSGRIDWTGEAMRDEDWNDEVPSYAESNIDWPKKYLKAGEVYTLLTSARLPFLQPGLQEMAPGTYQTISNAQATYQALSVLDTLYFPELPARQQAIPASYRDTYGWIYDNTLSPFAEWLAYGTHFFWVNGKAGSGKSTLMKFLATDRRTRHALRSWAKGERLCVMHFYFWNAGHPMQKTQLGLLQSLLFQVFSKCPEVIRTACPARWYASRNTRPKPWSRRELETALNAALSHQNPPTRFCLFVDGLDEFEGDGEMLDHHELNSYLVRLTQSANVKLCISSRPWHVFEDQFGLERSRTLRVQDLNKGDIETYVRGKLEEDERFKKFTSAHTDAMHLAEEVREAADGVFLWVYLVTKSLLRGLSERDNLQTLRRRLSVMPRDLYEYFRHMLHGIDDVYREHTSRSLLMAIAAREPLPALAYRCMELEMERPKYATHEDPYHVAHRMLVVDRYQSHELTDTEDESVPQQYGNPRMSRSRTRYRRDAQTISTFEATVDIINRFGSWGRDLLEVRGPGTEHTLRRRWFLEYKVDFLHRSARDFLLSNEIRQFLVAGTDADYSPELSLYRFWLALYRSGVGGRETLEDQQQWRDKASKFAHLCQKQGCDTRREQRHLLSTPQINLPVDSGNSSFRSYGGGSLRMHRSADGSPQVDYDSIRPDFPDLKSATSDSSLTEQVNGYRKRDKFLSVFSRKKHSRASSATGIPGRNEPEI